jgi:Flp pilus assembly secretin CpaC
VIPEVVTPNAALTLVVKQSTGTNPPPLAFTTRALRTSTRLQDAQALVIGGLLSTDASENAQFTPWLHEIPVLGWLFKGITKSNDETELVIVVDPVIVRDPSTDVALWAFPDLNELMARPVPRPPREGTDHGVPSADDASSR